MDPQAHSCEIYKPNTEVNYTLKDLFGDTRLSAQQAVVPAYVKSERVSGLDIIHSNILFAKIAEQVSSKIYREKILYNHLRKLSYDYAVIDCPPNLGVITVNAIYAADIILIPVNYDKGALDGMADLLETIKEVREGSSTLYLIIRNAFDSRNKQTNMYVDRELEPFEKFILKTRIRKTEALNQSRIVGEPILVFDPHSKAASDYQTLVKEVLTYV